MMSAEGAAAILPAFTDILKSWVKIKNAGLENVARDSYVHIYKQKQPTPWTRARLTGETKPDPDKKGVWLVEASMVGQDDAVWVDKDKHVLYPRYNPQSAILSSRRSRAAARR